MLGVSGLGTLLHPSPGEGDSQQPLPLYSHGLVRQMGSTGRGCDQGKLAQPYPPFSGHFLPSAPSEGRG